MNPYSQLQMMQQAGAGQFIPGMGMMSPQSGGAAGLQAMASAYGSPISGEGFVDTSPMAGLGYSGPGASLVNFGGNMLLAPMMQKQGLMPMGNAGSYQQARRQTQFQNMQAEVVQNVSSADADSLFRNMRGMAAMSGMPMNADQTAAARSFSETLAAAGPSVDMFFPGMLDAASGESGSVQSLASQVMTANRYRIDPMSGALGFSADSNTKLVEGLFEDMFNADNLTSMQGLRAGDMGALYSRLSPEGLAGPAGSTRDRTIAAIQDIQGKGGSAGLTDIANEMGVDLSNLQGLSNAELSELRDSSSAVSDRITEADTDRISGQLQDYVKSLSAIREVFGENGNPNAPIPQLVGALEALTNNKMQQFDATRLNTMVRDMQSLSQTSGKSIDQLTAMQQSNIANINSMTGFGGEHFAGASTNYGVTTGQAFQQVGGATGFGALSREEAEAGAQSLFNRSMDSEMANTLGTMGRIEETGGIQDNAAGRDLKAAMAAVRSGDEFYTDDNGTRRRTPRREQEFRSFMQKGAVEGMGVSDFNMMLGQEFANREQLASDDDLQRGAVRQQFFAFEQEVDRQASATVLGTAPLRRIAKGADRDIAAKSITQAATDAMFSLTPEEFADENVRRQAMVDAMQAESAGINGLDLTDVESRQLADTIYGQSNDTAMERTGEGTLAIMQMQGRSVSNAQRSAESQASSLAARNEAMTTLGPKGSGMQRLFSAIQKQGDKGEDANISTLVGELFGAPDLDSGNLTESMEKVRDLHKESEKLSAQMDGASPEERKQLDEKVTQINKDLAKATADVKDEGRRIGIVNVEGEYNREDIRRQKEARREISSRTDRAAVRDYLKSSAKVTDEDLKEAEDSDVTIDDLVVMAEAVQEQDRELLGSLTDEMILNPDGANVQYEQGEYGDLQKEIATEMHAQVIEEQEAGVITEAAAVQRVRENSADYNKNLDNYVGQFDNVKKVGDLQSEEIKKQVIRNRKAENSDELLAVSLDDVEKRMEKRQQVDLKPLDANANPVEKLDRQTVLDARMSDEDFDKAIDTMKKDGASDEIITQRKLERKNQKKIEFEEAQDQLIAERGLQATGVLEEDESLMDKDLDLDDAEISDKVRKMLTSGDPTEQRKALTQIARDDRKKVLQAGGGKKADISTQDVRGVADSLAQLDATADEYLRDADAIMRGGSKGLDAAKDYQEARKDLQAMSNRYSVEKGELGAGELLASGVSVGEVTEVANKEFEEMAGPEKDAAFKKVNEALKGSETLRDRFGDSIAAGDEETFKEAYAAVRAGEEQENLDEIRERLDTASEGMEAGADTDYRNILQVSDEQTEAARKLFGNKADVSAAQAKAYELLENQGKLGDDPDENKKKVNEVAANLEILQSMSTEESDALGDRSRVERAALKSYETSSLKETMTEDEYMDVVRGGSIDSLKMFSGDEKKFDEARNDILAKNKLENQIGEQDRRLKLRGGKDAQAQATKSDLQKQLSIVQSRIDSDRGNLSEEEYRVKMSQQADVKKLEAQQERMSKTDGPDRGVMNARDLLMSDAEDEAGKLGKVGNATDTLLDAIGFDIDDDGRAVAKSSGFGSSEENKRMVADELKKLETVSDEFGDTELEKLDSITDEYTAAGHSSSKKDALAKKLGMDREELDSMMDRTDFMGLDKEGSQFEGMSEKERADELSEMFKGVEDKDLEKEIKEEEEKEMRLTGTLEVVGDIIGQATLDDVKGKPNAI